MEAGDALSLTLRVNMFDPLFEVKVSRKASTLWIPSAFDPVKAASAFHVHASQ
jgi:hypothetical protein